MREKENEKESGEFNESSIAEVETWRLNVNICACERVLVLMSGCECV